MSCWDSFEIVASNDSDFGHHGTVFNNFPGCGSCSFCCYQNDYDHNLISEQQNSFREWMAENNKRFYCTWTNNQGFQGKFSFRSSSLEKAREIARESVYDWATLLVEVSQVEPYVYQKH